MELQLLKTMEGVTLFLAGMPSVTLICLFAANTVARGEPQSYLLRREIPCAEVGYVEEFGRGSSGWLLTEVDGGVQTYNAPWSSGEAAIWDYPSRECQEVYLYADSLSSAGKFVGNYIVAGVEAISYMVAFDNYQNVQEVGTVMVTTSGKSFECPMDLPTDDGWWVYTTPLYSDYWLYFDPDSSIWTQGAPSREDWREVAEIGVYVLPIEGPGVWNVYLDDFVILGGVIRPSIERFSLAPDGTLFLEWTDTGTRYDIEYCYDLFSREWQTLPESPWPLYDNQWTGETAVLGAQFFLRVAAE